MTREGAEQTARGFFYGGFLLPWLWFANVALFWDMRKDNPVIAKWSIRSGSWKFSVLACLNPSVWAGVLVCSYRYIDGRKRQGEGGL